MANEAVKQSVIWDTADGRVEYWVRADMSVSEYHAMNDRQRAERLLYLLAEKIKEHFKV